MTDYREACAGARNALRERIARGLSEDTAARAAWLSGSLGRGAGDPLSDLDLNVVLDDGPDIDALATKRLRFATRFGPPLLWVDAPQNAPVRGGYFLSVVYATPSGCPVIADWSWWPRPAAVRRPDTRFLFDRIGVPHDPDPPRDGYLAEPDWPAALRSARAARTPEQARAEEARDRVHFFWMMLLIAAKYAARTPDGPDVPFGGWLTGLLRDHRAFLGDGDAAPTRDAADPPAPDLKAKLASLRGLGEGLESLTPRFAALGAAMPTNAPAVVYAHLARLASG